MVLKFVNDNAGDRGCGSERGWSSRVVKEGRIGAIIFPRDFASF